MKNAKRNWKTSLFGVIALLTAGLQIWTNPTTVISDPQIIATIATGVGLIAAKDADKSGTLPDRSN